MRRTTWAIAALTYVGAAGSLRATGLMRPSVRPSHVSAPLNTRPSYVGRVCVGLGDPTAEVGP